MYTFVMNHLMHRSGRMVLVCHIVQHLVARRDELEHR